MFLFRYANLLSFFIYSTHICSTAAHHAVYGVDYTTRLGGLDIVSLHKSDDIIGIVTVNLATEDLNASYAAQCDFVNTPTGQGQIITDITNLGANIMSIHQSFLNVSALLASVDALSLTSQKFSPGWNNIFQSWNSIVQSSATTAKNIELYCNNFTDEVMPQVVQLPQSEAILLLQDFIDDAQSLNVTAVALAQDITNLQQSIATLTFSFQQFVITQQHSIDMNIDQFNSDLQSQNNTIQMLDIQMSSIADSIGATILQSANMFSVFPIFGPFAVLAGIIAIELDTSKLNSLMTQEQNALNKAAADRTSIAGLEAKDALLSQANETVTIARELSLASTSLMGSINSIWAAAADDALDVIDFINDAIDIPLVMWAELNETSCYYQAMSTAMTQYSQQLSTIANQNICIQTLN